MKRKRTNTKNITGNVSFMDEKSVPTSFNFDFEGSTFGKPHRLLKNFEIQDESGRNIPFEATCKHLGLVYFFGDVVMINNHEEKISVEFRFRKSLFGFHKEARGIWVESEVAWYKLAEPSEKYSSIFRPYLRKSKCIIRLWNVLWGHYVANKVITTEIVKDSYENYLKEMSYNDEKFEEIYEYANFIYGKLITFHTDEKIIKSPFMEDLRKRVTDEEILSPNVATNQIIVPPPPTPPMIRKKRMLNDPTFVPEGINSPPPLKKKKKESTRLKTKKQPPKKKKKKKKMKEKKNDVSGKTKMNNDEQKKKKKKKRKREKHDEKKRLKKRKKRKRFHFYNEHHRFQNPYWKTPDTKIEDFSGTNRILSSNAGRMDCKFREHLSQEEFGSTLDWPKRRQFILIIEFLTMVMKRNEIIGSPSVPDYELLLIGGAPGDHIPFLSELFKNVKFVCFDIDSFTIKAKKSKSKRLEIHSKKDFTDFVHHYKKENRRKEEKEGRKLLLFSDYRSKKGDENSSHVIKHELDVQMNWVTQLKPHASMIRFLTPKYDENYFDEEEGDDVLEYLDGLLFYPVWGKKLTRECHLYVDNSNQQMKKKEYRIKKHEEQMMYFCNITRSNFYKHRCVVEGMDHCYDCRAEIYILEEYIRKFWVDIYNHKEKKRENIKLLSERISKEISSNRTLNHHSNDVVEVPKYLPERMIDNNCFNQMLDEE